MAESPPTICQTRRVVLGGLDPVVAVGVATLLRGHHRLLLMDCGPGETALEAALSRCQPQAVVLGEKTEPTTVERVRSTRPQAGVLVLAHNPTQGDVWRFLGVGANCVPRNVEDVVLVDAIHRTARGERFFAAADGKLIERRYPLDAEPLTDREREILVFLTKGTLYAKIAFELGISIRTAEQHAASLFRKLRVRGKHDLIGIPVPSARTDPTCSSASVH